MCSGWFLILCYVVAGWLHLWGYIRSMLPSRRRLKRKIWAFVHGAKAWIKPIWCLLPSMIQSFIMIIVLWSMWSIGSTLWGVVSWCSSPVELVYDLYQWVRGNQVVMIVETDKTMPADEATNPWWLRVSGMVIVGCVGNTMQGISQPPA